MVDSANGLSSENAAQNAAEEHTLGLAFVRNQRHHMVERLATVPLRNQGTATLVHVQVYLLVCLLLVCSPLRSRRFLLLVVGSKYTYYIFEVIAIDTPMVAQTTTHGLSY